jgi:Carboxypeptidase regulatory-like domain
MQRVVFVIAIAVLMVPCVVSGQDKTIRIIGLLTDSAHGVIPSALVDLKSVAGELTATTRTDPAGRFEFPAIAPNVYQLSLDAPGFKKSVIKVAGPRTGTLERSRCR